MSGKSRDSSRRQKGNRARSQGSRGNRRAESPPTVTISHWTSLSCQTTCCLWLHRIKLSLTSDGIIPSLFIPAASMLPSQVLVLLSCPLPGTRCCSALFCQLKQPCDCAETWSGKQIQLKSTFHCSEWVLSEVVRWSGSQSSYTPPLARTGTGREVRVPRNSTVNFCQRCPWSSSWDPRAESSPFQTGKGKAAF